MFFNPRQKPWPYQGINFAHPLAKGLVAAWALNERSGFLINNYVDHSRQTITNTGGTYSWISEGLRSTGSTTDKIAVPISLLNGKPGASLIGDVKWNTQGAYSGKDVTLFSHEGNSGSWKFTVMTDPTYGFSTRREGSTTRDSLVFTDYITTPERAKWAFVWDGVGNWKRIYKNGFEVTADLAPAHGAGVVATATFAEIGRTEDLTNGFNGEIYWLYLYDRALLASEVGWLNREPYAMFDDQVIILGGGGEEPLIPAEAGGTALMFKYLQMMRKNR